MRTSEGDTESDLLAKLGTVAQTYAGVRAVLVIGHSGPAGMRIARDCPRSWSAVGQYLSPLRPEYVALLACNAGAWIPVTEIAAEVDSLREIVASPETATKELGWYLVGWLVVCLHRIRISPEAAFFANLGLVLLGKNVVFHWTPQSTRKTTVLDVTGQILKEAGMHALINAVRAPR